MKKECRKQKEKRRGRKRQRDCADESNKNSRRYKRLVEMLIVIY